MKQAIPTCLLQHLPRHSLLQRLPNLGKASQAGVAASIPGRLAPQQQPVTAAAGVQGCRADLESDLLAHIANASQGAAACCPGTDYLATDGNKPALACAPGCYDYCGIDARIDGAGAPAAALRRCNGLPRVAAASCCLRVCGVWEACDQAATLRVPARPLKCSAGDP